MITRVTTIGNGKMSAKGRLNRADKGYEEDIISV
jgi:hypothetical protein